MVPGVERRQRKQDDTNTCDDSMRPADRRGTRDSLNDFRPTAGVMGSLRYRVVTGDVCGGYLDFYG
ncbi:hypothetical protein C8Q78DRAFT_184416 [Trametes maxima]|nr:hypothetical protein C8Q78DRAFT_184416 [Trametes maxima]